MAVSATAGFTEAGGDVDPASAGLEQASIFKGYKRDAVP